MPVFPPFFFFNDTATTEIYTLSLHDALPISSGSGAFLYRGGRDGPASDSGRWFALCPGREHVELRRDRKSTRLNSSHSQISYAVFCLKKKNTRCSTARIRPTR